MPGFTNPLSLETTDSFILTTYTENGYSIDQISSGLTLTMLETSAIKSVKILLNSYVNAQITTYTFEIVATVPYLSESDHLLISFPTEIGTPESLNCISADTTVVSAIDSCTYLTNLKRTVDIVMIVNNKDQLDSLESFKISIRTITNPITTRATSNFRIRLTDSDYNVINEFLNPLTISTL
jgi:hypothetical protein